MKNVKRKHKKSIAVYIVLIVIAVALVGLSVWSFVDANNIKEIKAEDTMVVTGRVYDKKEPTLDASVYRYVTLVGDSHNFALSTDYAGPAIYYAFLEEATEDKSVTLRVDKEEYEHSATAKVYGIEFTSDNNVFLTLEETNSSLTARRTQFVVFGIFGIVAALAIVAFGSYKQFK